MKTQPDPDDWAFQPDLETGQLTLTLCGHPIIRGLRSNGDVAFMPGLDVIDIDATRERLNAKGLDIALRHNSVVFEIVEEVKNAG